MAFDGLFTKAMTEELAEKLSGGKINKIYQPVSHELILTIRAHGENHRLLLSAHAEHSRAQLTFEKTSNPQDAPMFCMLMRKHLEGGIISKIHQPDLERIIYFDIHARNEIGDLSFKRLIIEIMGKHSNIILLDLQTNLIMDCIKHVPPMMNSYRTLLPGNLYLAPPAQEKLNPLTASKQDLSQIDFSQENYFKEIVANFQGISPLLARNMSNVDEFLDYMKKINRKTYFPWYHIGVSEVFYLFPLPNNQDDGQFFPDLSHLLDRFYFGKADRDRVKQQAADLLRFLQNELEKNKKKITKLEAELITAGKADELKKRGELLTANLYQLQKGQTLASVIDYYDETQPLIEIVLDPRKTPNENAQSYFAIYQKQRNAVFYLQEQITITKAEINYLESIIQQLEIATPSDIEGIREELIEQKYLRNRKTSKKKTNDKPLLTSYTASDGAKILVGRNNLQNDYLTTKLASKSQLWFHTKDIPGSHIVIRDEAPSEQTIIEAATLAAYFSKARQSSQVPVDYTQIRNVKKPSGAKPGYVIYENQKTIYVTPNEDLILQLRD